MAALTHNPSRRALLGAAVVLSFDTPVRQAHRLLRMSGESDGEAIQPPAPTGLLPPGQARGRNDERQGVAAWRRALRAFETAQAAVRACERRTAGAPWAQQAAIEEEYGACLDALYAALRRLLRVPAPDLAALAAKIELVIEHEVATLDGGEACLAALRRDARRLGSESGGKGMGTVSA